jgi:DNA (cytosine-5)-methyltransferase 1
VTRPRLLDLYCGAGVCSVGYHRAGFDVVGVDIVDQPNYPFDFIRQDALAFLHEHLSPHWRITDIDAIHASPPCQAFTTAQVIHGREHEDLLTPTRALLEQTGLPWVIENVPGAPMRKDLVLCGSMFALSSGKQGLQRHRWFEFSDPLIAPALVSPCNHKRQTVSVFGHGGHNYNGIQTWREAMGIDWMTRDELAQAIPPAYCELVGAALMRHLSTSGASSVVPDPDAEVPACPHVTSSRSTPAGSPPSSSSS